MVAETPENFGVIDSATNPVKTSGSFNFILAGLTPATTYYFRSYATNSAGTAYGLLDSFTTQPVVSSLPYMQDFELGAQGWTISGVNNNWVLGTPAKTFLTAAYSGVNAWVTKLTGVYDNGLNSSVVSPQFDFTNYLTDPVLRFYHKFRTENNWDGMVVEISINGGTWTKLDPVVGTGANFNTANSHAWYNNTSASGPIAPPKFSSLTSSTSYSSHANGWLQSATRLTGAAGQNNVRFRFTFGSDGSGQDDGFAIDDIEVVDIITPSGAASNVNFTNIGDSTLSVNFTNGNGQGRIVVARLNTTIAVAPSNNMLYNANTTFGLGATTGAGNWVVYNGNASTVNVTGLSILTNYVFDVYEYNGKYMHVLFTTAASNNATTLTVRMLSFDASNVRGDVKLTWSTASELNNKGFEVERSVDGKRFSSIGFVKGAVNSNVVTKYNSSDNQAFSKAGVNTLYYRLKQVDLDGKVSFTDVRKVTADKLANFEVVAYPVPFDRSFNLSISSIGTSKASISIYDMQGRLVSSREEDMQEGVNTVNMHELELAKGGVYFVKVTQLGESKMVRVVKTN